jgi:hypothetical protein
MVPTVSKSLKLGTPSLRGAGLLLFDALVLVDAVDKGARAGVDCAKGIGPMRQVSVVMVRCPTTGSELSTGIEMDAATFEHLPEIRSQIKCPICRLDHVWSTREAWLDNPPPYLPAIAWLMLNNRIASND